MWPLVSGLCNAGFLDASGALGLKERPRLKIDKRLCGSNSLLPPTNSLLLRRRRLVGPLVDQEIADRLLDEGTDLPFSRRGHRGHWHVIRYLQQFRPHIRAISVRIVSHRGDDLEHCFQHQLRGYIAGDVARRRRFFIFRHDPLLYNVLKSSGTSPNFLITFASPNSPVAGSPVRLNATAPTCPGLRDNASARMTTATGLKHSVGSPAAMPSSAATKGSATK